MTNIEDTLWNHLVEHHRADGAQVRTASTARPRRRPLMIGTATGGVAAVAVAVAVVLVLSATTATPKAYALTPRSNGTYTLTINDLTTAVPHVNAELAKLGINARVIPVTSNCTDPSAATFPLPAPAPMSMSQSITIDNADIPAGLTGAIAAEQTPSGVELAIGTTAAALPSCLTPSQPTIAVSPTPSN